MPHQQYHSPDRISFDEAVISFHGYTIDMVPRILFQRINTVIQEEEKNPEEACEVIANILHASREQVRERLKNCHLITRPMSLKKAKRYNPWPAVSSIRRGLNGSNY